MRTGHRMALLLLAVCGTGLSLLAVIRFLLLIVHNGLFWTPGSTVRELYLAVGNSYSQGFAAGFFFAFSLSLAAVTLGTRRRRPPSGPTEASR